MPDQMPGLDYATVLNLYKSAQKLPQFQKASLPEFAKSLNEQTGTQLFSSGLDDSFLKRASVGVDTALEATHLPQATRAAGGFLGGLISPEAQQAGERIGEGLPRNVLDTTAMLGGWAARAAFPEVAIPAAALGATSTFAKGYTDTGSKGVGAVQTAATALLPGSMKLGEYFTAGLSRQLLPTTLEHVPFGVTSAAGEDLGTSFTKDLVPVATPGASQIPSRLVDWFGGTSGAVVNNELARQASSLLTEGKLKDPFTQENLVNQVGGLIPFVPFMARNILHGPEAGAFRSEGERLNALDLQRVIDMQTKNYMATWQKAQPAEPAQASLKFQMQLQSSIGETTDPEFLAQHFDEANNAARWASGNVSRTDVSPPPVLPREKTFLGKPIEVPQEPLQPSDYPSQQEHVPTIQKFTGQSIGDTVLGKGKPIEPQVPLVEQAQPLLQQKPKDLLSIEKVGQLTNQIHTELQTKFGRMANNTEWVSDENIAKKLGELSEIHTETEAYNLTLNWMYEKLTNAVQERQKAEERGPTSTVEQRVGDAVEKIGTYPESVQKLIADAVSDQMERTGDRLADSGPLYRAAVNLFDNLAPDERVGADLQRRIRATVTQAARLSVRKLAGERVEQSLEEAFPPTEVVEDHTEVASKMFNTGQEALVSSVQHEQDQIEQTARESVANPITVDELSKHMGIVAQPHEVAFVNEAMRQLQSGEIRPGMQGKKEVYQFNNLKPLADMLGVNEQTARKYFKDKYLPAIRELVRSRMGVEEEDTAFAGLLNTDKYTGSVEGTLGPEATMNLPIGARQWFKDYAKARGMTEEESNGMADAATAIAAVYPQIEKSRIAELRKFPRGAGVLGATIMGLSESGNQSVIALKKWAPVYEALAKQGNEYADAYSNFLRLHIFSHETQHAAQKVYEQQLARPEESIMDPQRKQTYDKIHTWVDGMVNQDKETVLRALLKTAIPDAVMQDPVVQQSVKQLIAYGLTSKDEFLATAAGVINMGIARPSKQGARTAGDIESNIMYSPKYLADFAHMHYADVSNMTDAMIDLSRYSESTAPRFQYDLKFLNDSFRSLAVVQSRIDATVGQIRWMEKNQYENYLASAQQAATGDVSLVRKGDSDQITGLRLMAANFEGDPEARGAAVQYMKDTGLIGRTDAEAKTLKDHLGVTPNWFERWLTPVAQLAQMYPFLQPLARTMFAFNTIANVEQGRALQPFMLQGKNGKWELAADHPGLTRCFTDEKFSDAFNMIRLKQNENKSQVLDDAGINEICKIQGLNDTDTEMVRNLSRQTDQAMQTMAGIQINHMLQKVAGLPARVLMLASREKGATKMDPEEALSFGKGFTGAYIASIGNDPQKALQGREQLAKYAAQLDPQTNERMLQTLTDMAPVFQKFANNFTNRPGYTPEVRLGKYYVSYKTAEGENAFYGYKTPEEAQAKLTALQKDTGVDQRSVKAYQKTDRGNASANLSSEAAQAYQEIEAATFAKIKELMPDDAAAEADKYTPGGTVWKEVMGRSFHQYTLNRKLVQGREDINMMEGALTYISGVTHGLARQVTKDQAQVHMMADDFQQNPQMKQLMQRWVDTVINPPAKEWSTFKNVVFQYTLGANLSSMAMDLTHPLFTVAPHLTRSGASFSDSYGYLVKGVKQVADIVAWKKPVPNQFMIDDGGKQVSIFDKAAREGHSDAGIYQELMPHEDVVAQNMRKILANNLDGESAAKLLTKPLAQYAEATRNFFSFVPNMNTKAALAASYLFGLEKKGMSKEEAYNFALSSTEATMFGGGAAARPIDLFANKGNLYGAVGAWYTLKHFSTCLLGSMYRLGVESVGKTGLEGAEKVAAQKAFGQMMLTQVVAAGALGLPMVGGTVGLLDQMFPQLEAKKHLRESIAKMFGEDQSVGGPFTDALMQGVPTMVGSVDLQQRLGEGDILGMIDPYEGFDPAGIFGVGGSMVANLGKAVTRVSQGKYDQAARLVSPNAFKWAVRLYNDDGVVKDSQGRELFKPTDGQTLAALAGFRPKALSDVVDQQRLLEQSNDVEKNQMAMFHKGLARQLVSGDTQGVRQSLLDRAQQDQFYDPRAGLRSVVELAQAMTTPMDPNATGPKTNMTEREALARTYQLAQRPTETQLLMARTAMQRSVHLPGAGQVSPTELMIAQVADRFLASDPTMSRQRAEVLARRQVAQTPAGRGLLYHHADSAEPGRYEPGSQ